MEQHSDLALDRDYAMDGRPLTIRTSEIEAHWRIMQLAKVMPAYTYHAWIREVDILWLESAMEKIAKTKPETPPKRGRT